MFVQIFCFFSMMHAAAPHWIERPLWLSGLFEWPTFWGISVVTAAPRRTWFCACHRHWYPWLRLWFEHRGIFRSIVSAMAHFASSFLPSRDRFDIVRMDVLFRWIYGLDFCRRDGWLRGRGICLESMLSVEPLRESWFPLICCFTFV